MKKTVIVALTVGFFSFALAGPASARVNFNIGVGVGEPGYYEGPVYYEPEYPHYRYHAYYYRHHHHHHDWD